MDFIKKNLSLLGILVAFLIFFVGSIYLLNRKIQEQRAVSEDLQQKIEQRRELWSRKHFPSKENVNLMRNFAEKGAASVEETLKILRKGSLSFERIPGSACKAIILEARRRMTELLFQNDIKFPNKFQFGFDRYDVRPPDDNDTPMIQKQLKIVEELVRLLAEARFQEVFSIDRVEFENSRSSSVVSRTTPSPTSLDPLISMDGKFNYVDLPAYIYSVMPFELEVLGDTNSLRTFLNAMARSRYILLLRILSIENEKKEASTGKEWNTRKPSSEAASGKPSLPQPGNAPEGISEITRVDPEELPFVFGEEKIKVKMRIEWFEFRLPSSKLNANQHKK